MSILSELQPQAIWNYFEEICRIPRASKKEEKIGAYVLRFAQERKLPAQRDEAGNILIRKKASAGLEKKKTVILQCHLDMVCEKNSDIIHNFDTDPIIPYIENGWVKAKGTTLGADNGIGVASMLAILADDQIPHGPLECLFTVDEETGLTGAQALQPGFMEGKILLNLDSEDEGELCIGCAGGIDTVARFVPEYEKSSRDYTAFSLSVTGLKGGHSGDDIDKGHANSIKLVSRILKAAMSKYTLKLHSLSGGNLRNAIPREAAAVCSVTTDQVPGFSALVQDYSEMFRKEFGEREPAMNIRLAKLELPSEAFTSAFTARLVHSLYACPHGIQAMSRSIPGLVETSTNLASVKTDEQKQIVIATSQRSAINASKIDIALQVESVFLLAGAEVAHSTGYPGWEPNVDSEIIRTAKEVYSRLYHTEPRLRAIHAGLECGLFLEKYPHLDMVSFGPTIRSPHSPDERVEIDTVNKYWNYLLEVLKSIPEN